MNNQSYRDFFIFKKIYINNNKLNINISNLNKFIIIKKFRIYRNFNKDNYFRKRYFYLYIYLIY